MIRQSNMACHLLIRAWDNHSAVCQADLLPPRSNVLLKTALRRIAIVIEGGRQSARNVIWELTFMQQV